MFALSKKARIAWIALFAVLFSGVSTTLAALHFSDRVDFLAEICTVAGIKQVASAGENSGRTAPDKHDSVNCAQCLSSASAPAIETSPVVALFSLIAGVPAMPPANLLAAPANPSLPPPPRGPPALF